jgi:hypothetical protein
MNARNLNPYKSKSGATVSFTDLRHKGFYAVMIITPFGDIHDRIMTDDYQTALEYRRAFIQIAKNYFKG